MARRTTRKKKPKTQTKKKPTIRPIMSRNPTLHSAYVIDDQSYVGDVELLDDNLIKVKELANPLQSSSTVRRGQRHFIGTANDDPDKTVILLLGEATWQRLIAQKPR